MKGTPPDDQSPLAPLPFGNHLDSTMRGGLEECERFLKNLPKGSVMFDAVGEAKTFQIALSRLAMQDLAIIGGSSSPKKITHISQHAIFLIPFGTCESAIDVEGEHYHWGSPESGFFIPADATVTAESNHGAFLRLEIHPQHLLTTYSQSLGLIPEQTSDLALHQPRVLPFRQNGLNWQDRFRKLTELIEAYNCDSHDLTMAGIDNVFLRTCLMMLAPESFINPEREIERRPMLAGSLNLLLEQIEARITERITLSDLEAWSMRSGRSIQQAFQDKLGMSPTRWILSRRLERLRALLLQAPADATIAELARSCGFSRMATVIPEYTRRFGEKPSQTRKRRNPWAC